MYFGSVKFFRHLVAALLLSIVVSAGLCVSFFVQKLNLQSEIDELKQELSQQRSVIAQLQMENEKSSSAGADAPQYQSLYFDLHCTSVVAQIAEASKTVYLTFDDGPSAVTDKVLDVLSQKNVKATFFVVGSQLDSVENQERLRRIVADGHAVGIHTESHNYKKIYASVDAYLEDFYTVWHKVKELTGIQAEIFRFPGGSINSYNRGIYQDIISEMLRRGYSYYDWNVSSMDASSAKGVSSATIIRHSTDTRNYGRVILLMHDSGGKSTTANSLSDIIDNLKSKGYLMGTLDRSVEPIVFAYTN